MSFLHIMRPVVKYFYTSLISYDLGLKFQKYLSPKCSSIPGHLLLLQHNPVYTTGLREYLSKDEISRLIKLGAEYKKVDRGGLVTFHGPGQLVAYPIINLRQFKPSVKWYVCRIEQTIIRMCKELGFEATTSPHTGVWVGDNKICAIGVHVSRGITTHGLALNCDVDLSWYKHITPCGIPDKGVTSLSQILGKKTSVSDIIPQLLNSFSEEFQCELKPYTKEEEEELIKAGDL